MYNYFQISIISQVLFLCLSFYFFISGSGISAETVKNFEVVENSSLTRNLIVTNAFNTQELTDHDGSIIRCDGDLLLREKDDQIKQLTPLFHASTGKIHDLEFDPAGVIYVIADNGVFLASAESEKLIHVTLKEGAPKGKPKSAYLDKKRRLWIATDKEFGVIDTNNYHGYTFTDSDGLPQSSPIGIMSNDDESILFLTEAGTFRYHPDIHKAPTVKVVEVNGKAYSGGTIHIQYPNKVTFTLVGSGCSDIKFRVFPHERGRYKVLSVKGNKVKIGHLDPGVFDVGITALDIDLNRAQPIFLRVHVEWSFYYHPRFLIPLGLTSAGLIFAITLLITWKVKECPKNYQQVLVSALLFMWIGVQILAAIVPHARTWSIVGWAMYTKKGVIPENTIVGSTVVEGITHDGRTFPIDVGLRGIYKIYPSQLQHALVHLGNQASNAFIKSYNKQPGVREHIIGVQIKNKYRYCLKRKSPVRIPPKVQMRFVKERAVNF